MGTYLPIQSQAGPQGARAAVKLELNGVCLREADGGELIWPNPTVPIQVGCRKLCRMFTGAGDTRRPQFINGLSGTAAFTSLWLG